MKEVYTGTFECIYYIYYYPFDTQNCYIKLQLQASSNIAVINHENFIIHNYMETNIEDYIIHVANTVLIEDEETSHTMRLKVG